MNKLDLFLLLPIIMGFVFGIFKGLIKELSSLLAIVLGIYGAKLFAPTVAEFLVKTMEFSPKTAQPVAYLVLFVSIAISLHLVAKGLDKIFDSIALGGINKLLGGFFGALKYALIVSILLNVFDALDSRFTILAKETKENSMAYKSMMKLAPKLWEEAKTKY